MKRSPAHRTLQPAASASGTAACLAASRPNACLGFSGGVVLPSDSPMRGFVSISERKDLFRRALSEADHL